MKTVDYKFDLKEKVLTPFGEDGIIIMLGYDRDGVQYYVKGPVNDNWFDENELSHKTENIIK